MSTDILEKEVEALVEEDCGLPDDKMVTPTVQEDNIEAVEQTQTKFTFDDNRTLKRCCKCWKKFMWGTPKEGRKIYCPECYKKLKAQSKMNTWKVSEAEKDGKKDYAGKQLKKNVYTIWNSWGNRDRYQTPSKKSKLEPKKPRTHNPIKKYGAVKTSAMTLEEWLEDYKRTSLRWGSKWKVTI